MKPALALVILGLISISAWGTGAVYDLDLHVDFFHGSFTGTETVTYTNPTSGPLYELPFRLYPNSPYLYGDGTLSVDSATVAGTPVTADTVGDGTYLLVPLPAPVQSDGEIVVRFAFHGRAADWRNGRGKSAADYGIYAASPAAMTLAEFYPMLAPYDPCTGWVLDPVYPNGDPVTSASSDYTVTVTADAGLTVLSSGSEVGTEPVGDEVKHTFVGNDIRDFMLVVTSGYETRATAAGGTLVRTSFPPSHNQAAARAATLAAEALALYGKLFGPYSGTELDIVEAPLGRAAGVEYPGLILVGESYCNNPYDQFFTVIIAHEVAHQWWYAAVGNDVIDEPWLDEGLATYSSVLFLEHKWGKEGDSFFSSWIDYYRRARAQHPDLSVAAPVPLFPDSSTYTAFVYYGGAAFLDAVRKRIGDTAFFAGLSSYYRDLSGRIAHGYDLISHLEAACGCGLGDLASEFLLPAGERVH